MDISIKTIFRVFMNVLCSRSSALEIIYVLHNLKPACRVAIKKNRLKHLTAILDKYNLFYNISEFSVSLIIDKNKGYLSNSSTIEKNINSESIIYIYISKNLDITKKLKKYDLHEDDIAFGKLLGYPSCCSEFFSKNKKLAAKYQMDFTLLCQREFKSYSFLFNFTLFSFDVSLYSYFPCSLDCEATLELATKYFNFLKDNLKDIANEFKTKMSTCVLFSEYDGIFYSNRYTINGGNIIFYKFDCSTKNHIYRDLKSYKPIIVSDLNNIYIGDKKLQKAGIFLFR
jgi:hypothetical protein